MKNHNLKQVLLLYASNPSADFKLSYVEILELLLNRGTQTFSPREFPTGKSPTVTGSHILSQPLSC